jgi:hypothetical protein
MLGCRNNLDSSGKKYLRNPVQKKISYSGSKRELHPLFLIE